MTTPAAPDRPIAATTGIADQRRFAAALADAAAPVPPGIRARSDRAARSRFDVYRNNVGSSLVTALGRRFPVVEALVGEEFFRAMARIHVDHSRPRSPVLSHYGDDFPDFVAAFPPAAGLPYLADVARLEAALSVAYHAADRPVLAPGDLATIDPDRLPTLRLRPHPAAGLIASAHPIGSIWEAHQEGGRPGSLPAAGERVLVTRPDADVRLTRLQTGGAAFAAAIFAGACLEDAAAAGFDEDADFDFGGALVGLADLGALTGTVQEGDEER